MEDKLRIIKNTQVFYQDIKNICSIISKVEDKHMRLKYE